jgi:hypothetical protein
MATVNSCIIIIYIDLFLRSSLMIIHCPTLNNRSSGTTAFCFHQVIKISIGRNIIIQIMLANILHAEGNLAILG